MPTNDTVSEFIAAAFRNLHNPDKRPQLFIKVPLRDVESYMDDRGERYLLSIINGAASDGKPQELTGIIESPEPDWVAALVVIAYFVLCLALIGYVLVFFCVKRKRLSIPQMHFGPPPAQTGDYQTRQKQLQRALVVIQSADASNDQYLDAVMQLKTQWVGNRESPLPKHFPRDFSTLSAEGPLSNKALKKRLEDISYPNCTLPTQKAKQALTT